MRKWLNTSGQSYRALGKAKVDASDEATITRWLSEDGKLVKRPVLVHGDRVLVFGSFLTVGPALEFLGL